MDGTSNLNQLDQSKAEYRQLHTQESEWIKNNAVTYAAMQCNKDNCISEEEAENQLTKQAFNRVQYGTEGWDKEANEFLRLGQGHLLPTDENNPEVGPLMSFYATPEQRANANLYVEEYKKNIEAYKQAGIKQPTLEQILNDAREHGEYSEQMAENLIKGSLLISGLVLAPVAAGTPVAAEVAAFARNPVTYCLGNPAGCAMVAEEVAYTASGAVSVNSVVPDVPTSSVTRLMDDVVDTAKAAVPMAKVVDDVPVSAVEKMPRKFDTDEFEGLYQKAPEAKKEIDQLADEIASDIGGVVAKAPIKSQERAVEKIVDDYDGDPSRIKDLARNTIISPSEKMDDVVFKLQEQGANVKKIDGVSDPLGYSGINATIETKSGLIAEIQVNTPKMIYAKEPEPVARAFLGDDIYNAIAKETGLPGGEGHHMYEAWRTISDKNSEEAKAIAAESKRYYEKFR